MMIEEYDLVEASRNLGESVLQGSTGTVLLVYPSSPQTYEVEFIDDQGNSLALLTVKATDINLVKKAPVCVK